VAPVGFNVPGKSQPLDARFLPRGCILARLHGAAFAVWLGVCYVCVLCRNGYICYGMRIGNRISKFSNGTIFNDFEWPLTHISRSRYFQHQLTGQQYNIYTYNCRLIVSCIWFITWCHFQSPWVSYISRFQRHTARDLSATAELLVICALLFTKPK